MGAFVMAWLVAEGLIVYRSVKETKAPPGPGQLLVSSGAFVLLGLLAEAQAARPLAITLAWGFDIAAYFNIVPGATGEPKTLPVKLWPPAQAPDTVILPTGQ